MLTIPPKYFLTPEITKLLQSIEASKEVINSLEIPAEIESNIRRQSTLHSSLFSARIEGNSLTLEELPKAPSKSQKKQEVMNVLKALNSIYSKRAKDLSTTEILRLHKVTMEGLVDKTDLGRYRTEAGALFNAAGIAIYLTPRPTLIPSLMNKLISYLNSNKEPFPPIKACIGHYIFEKIHPFIDGNGRVGRLILQASLQKEGYGLKGLLPLEEYLDSHRSEYYEALEDTEKDITDYLEFMLTAIAETAEKTKKQLMQKQDLKAEDYLLPRRAELLAIIKDHNTINFDSLRRRFMNVNERTLRYDLKKLVDAGLVKKLGATNGVYYQIVGLNQV